MRLAGKVAVIVPGTYGVGHDAAVRFAAEGAKVVVGGADEDNGRKTLEAIARAGGAAHFVPCDILREADIEGLLAAAVARYGTLDAVFGCPDYYLPGLAVECSAADLDYSLYYNVRSLFFIAKHAVPHMAARAGGSLVFLGSIYGLVSGSSSCAYEVSKGTVPNLVRTFAERLGPSRVRVNCIAAGHIVEPARGRDLRDELPIYAVRDAAEVDRLARYYPLGRLALADDVARAAVYLASDDAAFATGATINVEGGFTAR